MPNDKKLYGLQDQESMLDDDVDEVLGRVMDDACETPGESFDAIAARIEWPIKVLVYRRMSLDEGDAKRLAENAIERALEDLDEERSDPDGDATEPSEGMKAAALAFGRAVVKDYVSWACEPTGEILEFTREQMAASEADSKPAAEGG